MLSEGRRQAKIILIKFIDGNIELPEGREFCDIVELATTDIGEIIEIVEEYIYSYPNKQICLSAEVVNFDMFLADIALKNNLLVLYNGKLRLIEKIIYKNKLGHSYYCVKYK